MGKDLMTLPKEVLAQGIFDDGSYDVLNDKLVQKYGNQTKPVKAKGTRGSISPYVGPWNKTFATHLVRRTMYGAKPGDIAMALSMSPSAAIDALLNNTPNPLPTLVNYYQNIYADTSGLAYGASWENAAYGDGTDNYYRTMGIKSMWLRNMVNQNFSINEKMVAFLSGLVPIGTQNVGDARFELQYHKLVRQYALGNYKDFIREVTKNGAMLYYLNGYVNNKFSPDENYARELQELFTVGKIGGPKYLETDVVEMAKILTGWRVDGTAINAYFDPIYHDTSNKQLSSFYGNAVIQGQAGANGGDLELNALLDVIFSGQSAQTAAHYVCTKLYRYFLHYEITPSVDTNIIQALAQTFINSNWDLKPVLAQLFKSDHFFELAGQGSLIKNPFDFCIGALRMLDVQPNPSSNLQEFYFAFLNQNYYLNSMGQSLLDPPNVSGYKAYYQGPEYHQLWINSNTYPKRLRWLDNLTSSYGFYVSAAVQYRSDLAHYASTLSNPADPDILIDDIIAMFFGVDVSTSKRDYFKSYILNNTGNNSYWTTLWNNYVANPTNTTYSNPVNNRLRQMIREMLHMCENQLC
jgi:uncharacterized protein (DUF1800 family)